MMLDKDDFNFGTIVYRGISLLVGVLGAKIAILNGLKIKKIKFFVVFCTFIGILVGNLYQGVLTETLIFPKPYETNLTLGDMVRWNFTFILIPESMSQTQLYENALKENIIDFLYFKYTQVILTNCIVFNLFDLAVAHSKTHEQFASNLVKKEGNMSAVVK